MIKIVKALSAVLGVLILGAVGLLGYGLFYKTSPQNPQQENAASFAAVPDAPSAPVAAVESFDAVGLGQPAGSSIAQATAQGTLVYLTVQGGGLADRILVVDLARHRVIGRIDIGDADSHPPRPAK